MYYVPIIAKNLLTIYLTVPTGPPQSVASLAINPWTLFIQWESPALEHRNGIIRRYIVNVTEQETGKEEQFYTEKFNITLDSRHPSFQYSYFVSAQSIALGPFSQAQIISMPEAGIICLLTVKCNLVN